MSLLYNIIISFAIITVLLINSVSPLRLIAHLITIYRD